MREMWMSRLLLKNWSQVAANVSRHPRNPPSVTNKQRITTTALHNNAFKLHHQLLMHNNPTTLCARDT